MATVTRSLIGCAGAALVGALHVLACSSFRAAEGIRPGDTGDTGDAAIASDAGPVPAEAGATSRRRAFVTSKLFTGNVGATPAEWDEQCQAIALSKGFSGAFIAWLSASNGPLPPAGARLGLTADDVREWFDVDDVRVATAMAFANGNVTLYVDEDGNRVADSENVWTGTGADGGALVGDCNAWRSDSSMNVGWYGEVNASGPSWTGKDVEGCDAANRLYCFEK